MIEQLHTAILVNAYPICNKNYNNLYFILGAKKNKKMVPVRKRWLALGFSSNE